MTKKYYCMSIEVKISQLLKEKIIHSKKKGWMILKIVLVTHSSKKKANSEDALPVCM